MVVQPRVGRFGLGPGEFLRESGEQHQVEHLNKLTTQELPHQPHGSRCLVRSEFEEFLSRMSTLANLPAQTLGSHVPHAL